MPPCSLSSFVWPDFPSWCFYPQHRHLHSPRAKGHGVCAALGSLPLAHRHIPSVTLSPGVTLSIAAAVSEALDTWSRFHQLNAYLAGCATLLPVVCTWGLLQKAPWDYKNSLLWCLGVYITLGLAHNQGVTRAEGGKPSSILPNETNSEVVLMLQSAPWGEPGAGASLKAPSGLSLLLLWLVSLPVTGFCWEQLHGKFLSMDPRLESPPQNSLVECPPFHSGSYHLSSWSTMEAPRSPSQLLTHPAHRLFYIILRMSLSTALLWSKGSDHCSSAVGSRTNSAWSSEPSTPGLQSINH